MELHDSDQDKKVLENKLLSTVVSPDSYHAKAEEKREENDDSSKVFAHLSRSISKLMNTLRPAPKVSDDDESNETVEVRFVKKQTNDTDFELPRGLRVAAAYSWRFLLIVATVFFIVWLAVKISIILIPVMLALLFSVLLEPIVRLCVIHLKMPRVLAAVIALIIGLGVVIGLITLASTQLIASLSDVVAKAQAGVNTMINWLSQGPLHIDLSTVQEQWAKAQQEFERWLTNNTGSLASGAVGAASTAATFASGALMCLFCLFFFMKDGRKMWQWLLRLVPTSMRYDFNEAAIRGWVTLGSYARTQMAVAAIDAAGIGVGASFLVGVSLAVPIGVLVFIGAFIPIVGAITTGAIAVFVALVVQGFKAALWMLFIILLIQQIESNVLHPFMMSSAVSLHPVVVLLVVVAGGYVAGIIGAIFSVPIAAFINTATLYLTGHDKFLALNFDKNRPGGPPGCLTQEMKQSFQPSKDNLKKAVKARKKAIENGDLHFD